MMSGDVGMHNTELEDLFEIKCLPEDGEILKEMFARLSTDGVGMWTFIANHHPVCIWGCVPLSPGRGLLWAVMGQHHERHLHSIIRIGKRKLNELPYHRLELDVREDFEEGLRFAEMLGFKRESFLEQYYPDRSNAIGFVRLAPWQQQQQ